MTVPKAGHFIPYNNYNVSIQVLNDIIGNGSLVCHQQDGNCTVTDIMCEAMKSDNSSGVCGDDGQYVCNEGYIGADCTQQYLSAVADTTTNFTDVWIGYKVQYFAFTGLTDDFWSIQIEAGPDYASGSMTPMNLYAINGLTKAPSKFNHNLMLADMKESVTVTSGSYNCGESCVFALESIGYNQAKNAAEEIHVYVELTR